MRKSSLCGITLPPSEMRETPIGVELWSMRFYCYARSLARPDRPAILEPLAQTKQVGCHCRWMFKLRQDRTNQRTKLTNHGHIRTSSQCLHEFLNLAMVPRQFTRSDLVIPNFIYFLNFKRVVLMYFLIVLFLYRIMYCQIIWMYSQKKQLSS